jgi:hypothetical protein
VFPTAGSVTVHSRDGGAIGEQALSAGDALRITDGCGERVAADEPAELLVWQMHASQR